MASMKKFLSVINASLKKFLILPGIAFTASTKSPILSLNNIDELEDCIVNKFRNINLDISKYIKKQNDYANDLFSKNKIDFIL